MIVSLVLLLTIYLTLCDVGTVYHREGKFEFVFGKKDKDHGVAWGEYKKEMDHDGWSKLVIETKDGVVPLDMVKAEAAGYLEGCLTYQMIHDSYENVRRFTWDNSTDYRMPRYIKDFFFKHENFVAEQIMKHPMDPFYIHLALLQLQVKGMIDGYNAMAKEYILPAIPGDEFMVLLSLGDLYEVKFWKKEMRPDFEKMTEKEISDHFIHSTHCSALWKLTPDNDDLLFFHNTWNTYGVTLRIFKEYDLKFSAVKSSKTIFPSYAGMVASFDDFYITTNDLAIIETTNGIFNATLYDLISPDTLMYWQRVMIANRLAGNAKDWCSIFSNHNSGTYNNQWMVLDMKKFERGAAKMDKDVFWVCEQMPGEVRSEDQSEHLSSEKYWPSYNVPFYQDINTKMGYPDQLKKHPELKCKYDYNECARAQIFKRDNSKVTDVDKMKTFSKYNDYKNDPLSLSDSALSIASRYEFSQRFENCHGAFDSKVGSVKMWMEDKKIWINGSPTFDVEYIPKFNWSDPAVVKACPPEQYPHLGAPEVYDFDWVEYHVKDHV